MIPPVEERQIRPCFALHRIEHPNHTCIFFSTEENCKGCVLNVFTPMRDGIHYWDRPQDRTCKYNISHAEVAELLYKGLIP